MWGLALDHVEEVEVVIANSSVVRASEQNDLDLLFAIKGAAASFGIVAEFKIRTQAEPEEMVLYSYNIALGTTGIKGDAFKQWQRLISDPTPSRKFTSTFTLMAQAAFTSGTFFGSQQEYDGLNISSRIPNNAESVVDINDWLGVVGHWAENVGLNLSSIPGNFYAKSVVYTKDDLLTDKTVDSVFKYINESDKDNAL